MPDDAELGAASGASAWAAAVTPAPARPVVETKPAQRAVLGLGPTDAVAEVVDQAPPLNAGNRPPPAEPAASSPDGSNHPLVKHAMELFGARVVDIQPRRQG